MQYGAAEKYFRSSPCTNVPIHCPICPTSVLNTPQTIWKYNALFHLISEHATGFTSPKIPRQLMADMHITKEEKKALGIEEEVTACWREQHDIPGSESLLEMMQAEEAQKKREIRHSFHSFFWQSWLKKGSDICYTRINNFLGLVYRRNVKY